MGLLEVYDPPARLQDFDAIKGQRMAWHRFMADQFAQQIRSAVHQIPASSPGTPTICQFYDASSLSIPAARSIEQAVVWNAFPKELLQTLSGATRALIEADRLWPSSGI